MSTQKPTTIDAYIRGCAPAVQPILQKIRDTIRQAVPEATEGISYQMPTFKFNGTYLVYFGAWKNHIGFYATPGGNAAFQKELAPYKAAKGSVQFPLDQPIPYDLIRKMAQYRKQEALDQRR